METTPKPQIPLTRYAWLSIAAAIITISMKASAYFLTGSVGLLSDALESTVNLAAAIVALIVLRQILRPANEQFAFGYSKAEYFASGFEGGMILLAAAGIVFAAIPRLIHPVPRVHGRRQRANSWSFTYSCQAVGPWSKDTN